MDNDINIDDNNAEQQKQIDQQQIEPQAEDIQNENENENENIVIPTLNEGEKKHLVDWEIIRILKKDETSKTCKAKKKDGLFGERKINYCLIKIIKKRKTIIKIPVLPPQIPDINIVNEQQQQEDVVAGIENEQQQQQEKDILESETIEFIELKKEKEILEKIKHSCVLEYYGYSEDEENEYLYMEFIQGGIEVVATLTNKLLNQQSNSFQSEDIIRRVAFQLVLLLNYIHYDVKLVHCNIRPDNVLISDQEFSLKLLEFGNSKDISFYNNNNSNNINSNNNNNTNSATSNTTTTTLTNTSNMSSSYSSTTSSASIEDDEFIAPEIKSGKESTGFTIKSDIWSLGCLLLLMVGGDPKITTNFEPTIPYHLSANCKNFIQKCLIQDPYHRYDTNSLLSHKFIEKSNIEIGSNGNNASRNNGSRNRHENEENTFQINGNELTEEIPNYITTLIFQESFQQDIVNEMFTDSIKHLEFSQSFNKLDFYELPEQLSTLIYYGEFNNDSTNQSSTPQRPSLKPREVPRNIVDLQLPNYNMKIRKNSIPDSCKFLVLGQDLGEDEINTLINLPSSIIDLEFGCDVDVLFNFLTPEMVPTNVTCLKINGQFISLPFKRGYNSLINGGIGVGSSEQFNIPIDELPDQFQQQFQQQQETLIVNSLYQLTSNALLQLNRVGKLIFGNEYDDELLPGTIKSRSILELEFGTRFNQTLSIGSIPNSITKLSWNDSSRFNQPLIKDVIPARVLTLKFGKCWNQPLEPGVITDSVTSCSFGSQFNQKIELGCLPLSIKELKFGDQYNQPTIEGSIPDRVKRLTFGNDHDQTHTQDTLPKSLVYLEFGESQNFSRLLFSTSSTPSPFPPSTSIYQKLTTLIFKGYHTTQLKPGDIPISVTNLVLSNYQFELEKDCIPMYVKTLVLSNHFNHVESLKHLPKPSSITSLTFGCDKEMTTLITPSLLPSSITTLIINNQSIDLPINLNLLNHLQTTQVSPPLNNNINNGQNSMINSFSTNGNGNLNYNNGNGNKQLLSNSSSSLAINQEITMATEFENQKYLATNTPTTGSWLVSIPNFSNRKDQFYSSIFPLIASNWRLKFYTNGKDANTSGKLSIFLSNCDLLNNPFLEKSISYKLTLINQKNPNESIQKNSAHTFNIKEFNHGYGSFIGLFSLLNPNNGFLVNNCLKVRIEAASTSPLINTFDKYNIGLNQAYCYSIPQISKKVEAFVSPTFMSCGRKWLIKIYPSGQPISNYVSVFLEYRDEGEENVLFSLELISQLNPEQSIKYWVQYKFSSRTISYGYPKFCQTATIMDPEVGFLVNDSIILNVTILQLKPIKRSFFN